MRCPGDRLCAAEIFGRYFFLVFSYRYGIYFFQFWLPTYLVSGRGYSETALLLTTWLFAGGAVANVTGGWASDALVKRLGLKAARRTVPFAGLMVSALSLTLTIFVARKYYLLVLLTLGSLLTRVNLVALNQPKRLG